MSTHDPFERLAAPVAAREPHPRFTALLRDRLVRRLRLDGDADPTAPIRLPERTPPMSTPRPPWGFCR